MTALVVVGTRPEAIKLGPVIEGLRRAKVPTAVCTTGQHATLALDALRVFGIQPEHALSPAASDLVGLLAATVVGLREVIARTAPRIVLVHGDTTSAVAGGLAALYAAVPIAHVEAGLRAGDRAGPFPEEANRRLLDAISTWFLAPTAEAAAALRREGHDPARIFVTGNPVVDALFRVRGQVMRRPCADFPELAPLDLDDPSPVVLVTAHRRESFGEGIERICAAVGRLDRVRIVWPLHPNPEVSDVVRRRLGSHPRVALVPPLSYPAFVRALLRADLVMTDSGGVQEEAAILGRPTLVLRNETERPEVLGSGVVRLVGTDTAEIVRAATTWLERPPTAIAHGAPLGDGRAGERIGELVAGWLR